jgi:Calcium binding
MMDAACPQEWPRSENSIALALVSRRSLVGCRSDAPPCAESTLIVDAGPEEQALSWYRYLESKIRFPFQAKCLAAKVVSPLRKGETVEVVRMAPDDVCAHDMLVLVRWQGRNMVVPLAPLTAVDPDESTAEAIADWHYWVAQGYCL